jgi:single-strand DNA-binding protein
MYLNKAMVYGNLTRDPEVKALPSGVQVCSFSVATNRTYKDRDGNKQEQAEYHNVVAFAKLAEIIGQYLKKGRPIYIEGRMQTRSWEKDGVKQYRTEIVADNFQFGASAPGEGGGAQASAPASASTGATEAKAPAAPEYPEEDINPEDIPF